MRPDELPLLGRALVDWFETDARDLPWRHRRDSYAIWVSEIMLQQTTVAAVLRRYEPFLERFPDIATLASAEEDEVLAELQGLGYYRRFRALKRAADELHAKGQTELPRTLKELRALPGIGTYTAGAIASIAFDLDVAAVDGNVVRVLSRLFCIDQDARAQKRYAEIAETMMPAGQAALFNQSLFDLGATICSPKTPRCPFCPLRKSCEARARGVVESFPPMPPRPKPTEVQLAAAYLARDERIVFVRRPDEASRMPGFLELPECWLDPDEDPEPALLARVKEQVGVDARFVELGLMGEARHSITRYRLRCSLYRLELPSRPSGEVEFLSPSDIRSEERPISTLSLKLLRAAGL